MDFRFCVILLFNIFSLHYCLQNVCLSQMLPYQNHLGTKSPYRFTANLNNSQIQYPGCEPARIWMVVRHGTRYPGIKKIKKMQNVLLNLRDEIILNANNGTLCTDEIELLRNWQLSPHLADDKNLAHEGEDEMIDLAERMQQRFPTLFPEEYSNSTYQFKYTATQRCAESARHFTIGLFGRKVSRYVWFPQPIHKDPILRFYKACEKWRKTVKKSPQTYQEIKFFETSEHVMNAQKDIAERLGLKGNLTVDTLQLMYGACAFETAWSFRQVSPWCSVFTEDTLKILEYLEDLKYYWVDGYGYELTAKQACPAIRNLYEFFELKKQHLQTSVYFTHSGTILKMLSHLNLYKDPEPLRNDNYEISRLWRVSKIDSFGSNIAFILYNCDSEPKIMALHQERVIHIPGCPDTDLCPLDVFKNVFYDSIYNCQFDEMCSVPYDNSKENKKSRKHGDHKREEF